MYLQNTISVLKGQRRVSLKEFVINILKMKNCLSAIILDVNTFSVVTNNKHPQHPALL